MRRLRLAIDKPRRLHQSFRLAPSTACAFAALRGARRGQRVACLAASRALARLGGGSRWCRVGDRVGARSRWKRPFDFPILPINCKGVIAFSCNNDFGKP